MAARSSLHLGAVLSASTLRLPCALLYHSFESSIREKRFMADETRVATLQEILKDNPNDAFARYALGLEYSGAGETETALAEFAKLLEAHPDYTNGYFMAAQALARAERTDEARAMLQKGMESARRTNNRHALSEMEAMMDEWEQGN
jgi:tetratricopeptide (TPR) repeat protein